MDFHFLVTERSWKISVGKEEAPEFSFWRNKTVSKTVSLMYIAEYVHHL